MVKKTKIIIVAGTRPNFIKVAPLIKAFRAFNECGIGNQRVSCKLVHTGQHYDHRMSEIFFSELGIHAPDFNLEVGPGSHAQQTAKIMTLFEDVCVTEQPDWVVVVGDVNSTMACTLVCAKLRVRVAHVEAGLRSFDRSMPEEINRIVTDSLADLHLTPSVDAEENLKKEGIPPDRIVPVGNIMIDTLVENLTVARASRFLENNGLDQGGYVYVTLHRPSNVDDPGQLRRVTDELKVLAKKLPVIFAVHPRTLKMIDKFAISIIEEPDLKIVDPVGYHDSLSLTENARFILTDSGGLQEESTFFHTPCLTLRQNTERPVTVTLGSNKLTCIEHLHDDIDSVLSRRDGFTGIPPMWDGLASARVVDAIVSRS